MKRKWWVIPIAVALILVVVTAVFWDAIAIRVMPNVVLSKALVNTMAAIETRLENSPLTVLSRGMDPSGCSAVDLKLDTSNAVLGDIRYEMNVRTAGEPRKLHAQGTVSSSGGSLNLSLYADKDFAAVSSENLLDGKFYGITYDTFSEDIRGIPLLPLLIGEKTLSQWESSVSELQSQMEQTYEIPDLSREDIQTVLMGFIALKAQVSSETLAVNSQNQKVYKVSYSATGQQIASMAGDYVQHLSPEVLEIVKNFANDPNSTVSASFYLLKETVVKLIFDVNVDGEAMQAELILGQNAARDPVRFASIRHSDTVLDKWSVDVQTEYDENTYSENWSVVHIENGFQSRNVIDYSWNTAGGDMMLNVTDAAGEASVSLNLQPTDSGFRLATEQFESLISAFSDDKKTGNSACVMSVSKGTEVVTPEYKNIDQWTGDDLLSLLGSIGSLIGLQI